MGVALLAVAFLACVSAPFPRTPTSYPARPVTVTVRDSGAFNRALQVAIAVGFQATKTDAATGLFTVERMQLDTVLTAQKAERWVGGPAPPDYFRKCIITAIMGGGEATVSPSVIVCRDNRHGVPRCGLTEPELNWSEADTLEHILEALSPPPKTRSSSHRAA